MRAIALSVITQNVRRERMNKRILVSVVLIILLIGAYGTVRFFNHAVDLASGVVVERTLSDNKISQLKLLSDIEESLEKGNVQEAQRKLSEAKENHLYILRSYCHFPKCVEAVNEHSDNEL